MKDSGDSIANVSPKFVEKITGQNVGSIYTFELLLFFLLSVSATKPQLKKLSKYIHIIKKFFRKAISSKEQDQMSSKWHFKSKL